MQAVVRLFREARRRKVLKTSALYVVGAWLALQVADVLFPAFGIPETALRALVWAAVLGFPVVLVFGWLFEIGAEGIRRTPPLHAGEVAEVRPLARSDYVILAAFAGVAVALTYKAVDDIRHARHEGWAEIPADTAAAPLAKLDNSVAVLPFDNISDDPDNDNFCDGVSEDILNKLASVAGLNVIGRTSSFAFRQSDLGIKRVSAALGVHFVLRGSVRRAGEQLRISAALLKDDGVQVWSQTFDRTLDNVFAIQSEIADAVAGSVAARVTKTTAIAHQPRVDAYEHFLSGRALVHSRLSLQAFPELERAVALDPEFAEAYAELAVATLIAGAGPPELVRARALLDKALDLNPRLLRAQAAQGLLLSAQVPPDLAGAERALRGVLDQDPNMSDALLWLANALKAQGRDEESRSVLERAARIDPFHPSVAANLAGGLVEAGRLDEADSLLERQLEQPKPGPMIYYSLMDLARGRGHLVDFNRIAKREALDLPYSHGHLLIFSYAFLNDYKTADRWLRRFGRAAPDDARHKILTVAIPAWRGEFANVGPQMRRLFGEDLMLPDGIPAEIIGGLLARSGEYAAAIRTLEPLVDPSQPEATYEIAASSLYPLHALAWSYQHAGLADKAAVLLEGAARSCERASVRSRNAFDLHRCAETELLRGNKDRAIDGFAQAVAAGWRDYYVRQNDPYWSAVANDPRYRQQVDIVKADIARQRAEVERIDARDDFVAKFEASESAHAARLQRKN